VLFGNVTGLTTATLETLNWDNLTDVKFSVTSDAGLDNISAAIVPEPGSGILLLTGVAMFAVLGRRKLQASR
jgi:hypothetical protein